MPGRSAGSAARSGFLRTEPRRAADLDRRVRRANPASCSFARWYTQDLCMRPEFADYFATVHLAAVRVGQHVFLNHAYPVKVCQSKSHIHTYND